MALLHNSIFRGYNSIYLQAPHVQDADKADFIGYALTWFKFVKSHHDDEEESLFTKIEELLDDKTVFEETHKEHGMSGNPARAQGLSTTRHSSAQQDTAY
jgi:hemerythrin-like domain-containing protein